MYFHEFSYFSRIRENCLKLKSQKFKQKHRKKNSRKFKKIMNISPRKAYNLSSVFVFCFVSFHALAFVVCH